MIDVPSWTLDETRFREKVLRAVDNQWDPSSNLFRCYQLPLDVGDATVIAAALKGVRAFVNKNAIRGNAAAKRMMTIHSKAEATLTNPTARAAHRVQVDASYAALQESLRLDVGGLKTIPPSAYTAIAATRERLFSRDEVMAALSAIGCSIREPVPILRAKLPGPWREVQNALSLREIPNLRTYLKKYFGGCLNLTSTQFREHEKGLQRTVSGDDLTAESKILSNVEKWSAAGQLTELLRTDLLRELSSEAAMSPDRLAHALAQPEIVAHLRELQMPSADDIAYALICELRYPAAAGSTWQAEYREARTSRDLRTALDILSAQQSLDKEFLAARDALKAELEQIDAMLERARASERSDSEQAAELYWRAAQRSRDSEAEAGLARCRPSPPERLVASVRGDAMYVEWSASAARVGDIAYRLVRLVEGGGSGDGAVLGSSVRSLSMVDADAPSGVPVAYAVWTLRDDQPSAQPRQSQPISRLRGVQGLELLPADQWIELRWEPPERSAGARITRREVGTGTGSPMTVRCEGDSYRDQQVRVGGTYEYSVESEYRLPHGAVGYGPSAIERIRRQEPPQPVRDLTLAIEDDTMLLTWTPPPRGNVEIRDLDVAPDIDRPGQLTSASGVRRLGVIARATEPPSSGRQRMAAPTDGRRHWLVPLTVLDDGSAVIGTPVEYGSRLPAVSDLKAERFGDRIRLLWRWPPSVSEVLVLSRAETPPTGPDDSTAQRKPMTYAAYQRAGCHVGAIGGTQWLGVCVTAPTDGVVTYGPVRLVQVSTPGEATYEVQRISGWRNRNVRRLVVNSPSTGRLGGVTVVARPRVPPLRPEDGEALAHFPAPENGQQTIVGQFDLRPAGRPLFIKAFPADGSAELALIPLLPGQLRID